MSKENPKAATAAGQPRTLVSKRLLIQLRVFGIIFVAMLGVLVYDVLQGQVSLLAAVGGLALGLVIGLIVSRMYRLTFDEQAQQVAGRIDWVGGVILALYLLFVIFRNPLFSSWVDAAQLAAFGLSVSAGTMLGRLVGTRRGVRRVLTAWGVARREGATP